MVFVTRSMLREVLYHLNRRINKITMFIVRLYSLSLFEHYHYYFEYYHYYFDKINLIQGFL